MGWLFALGRANGSRTGHQCAWIGTGTPYRYSNHRTRSNVAAALQLDRTAVENEEDDLAKATTLERCRQSLRSGNLRSKTWPACTSIFESLFRNSVAARGRSSQTVQTLTQRGALSWRGILLMRLSDATVWEMRFRPSSAKVARQRSSSQDDENRPEKSSLFRY